jgi:outer membrane protein OmpA-like peptidoglycan-associated protein
VSATGAEPTPPVTGSGAGVGTMAGLIGAGGGVVLLLAATLGVKAWVSSATDRLEHPAETKAKVAIADQAEVAYCTPRFKEVLERVLHSCGLAQDETRRGCKPADVKTFASISDSDFNELFTPLKDRGAVILFDEGMQDLDEGAKKLLEDKWFQRKGARYFFVVARASKSGNQAKNRALSHRRANSVMFDLTSVANDPEIDKKVGLLWLGNEFAQLSKDYCGWPTSRPNEKCDEEAINRSAFVSWVDCRL